MQIRYICSDEERRTDAVLSAVAEGAEDLGLRLCGTVQPVDRPDAGHCDIVLALLPDFQRRSISLELPPGTVGCRLDAGALEQVVAEVQSRLEGAQALLVNKFGKQEAAGRALVPVIGEACARGLPVLVGVAPQWREAFLGFAGDAALPLPDDAGLALDWLRQSCLARI
ncbi:DUF2478 domain-containing protein [Paracoccus limosus]|uniref:DUF2478 domain-containing protein n=1 Tax=Paracoccus limosus TaxID=913252 RepID=A0A844H0A6_9RHOB|nr:DUF2478 domain-containing protein [Paracoccus limosus]MTH34299.1 DUF2478 domain-containing protein [Paracoccus limosus]